MLNEKVILSDGKDRVEISKIVMGNLNCQDSAGRDMKYACMREYMELGGNAFDTARIYGGYQAEKYLGEFVREYGKRDELNIITKCAHPDMVNREWRLDAGSIYSDIETSLTMLKTDYVDVLLLHRDDIRRPVEEIMIALHNVVKKGQARMIGASNWTAKRIKKANEFAINNGLTPFCVSQINYSAALATPASTNDLSHVIMDRAEKSWYEESKIPVMSWASSARGFFSQVVANGVANDKNMEWYGWCPENFERADRIAKIANEKQVSVGTIVLSYLLSQELTICPIISFSKKQQFDEAMSSVDCVLSKDELSYIENGF